MKTKFIILFNSNRKRCFYKYRIVTKFDEEVKMNGVNGFNEKIVGMITIPYTQYLEEKKAIQNRFKH